MNYLVLSKIDLGQVDRFASARDAEKYLRTAEPGTYVILRTVADDVVVEEPPPAPATNRVRIGKRSFSRPRKAKSANGADAPSPDAA